MQKVNEKGFTLIEMLVAAVIFILILVAIYFLFDQGRWYYLAADRRSNIQENGRLALEQMERDFRMVGYGVPRAGSVTNTGDVWTPPIFSSATTFTDNTKMIGFIGDVDNGGQLFKLNAGTENTSWIFPEDVSYYQSLLNAGTNPIKAVLVSDRRKWEAVSVQDLQSANTALEMAAAVTNISTFTADKSEIYTLERVCYVLDPGNATTEPFNSLKRSVVIVNGATSAATDRVCPPNLNDASWETIATNVLSLELHYWTGGAQLDNDVTGTDEITMDLVLEDRSHEAAGHQTYTLHSDVLFRNRRP
jgi:prepilin-type N-terminal cleavage/methylation domain-containing protein